MTDLKVIPEGTLVRFRKHAGACRRLMLDLDRTAIVKPSGYVRLSGRRVRARDYARLRWDTYYVNAELVEIIAAARGV